mgnify:CR=1 FL=1
MEDDFYTFGKTIIPTRFLWNPEWRPDSDRHFEKARQGRRRWLQNDARTSSRLRLSNQPDDTCDLGLARETRKRRAKGLTARKFSLCSRLNFFIHFRGNFSLPQVREEVHLQSVNVQSFWREITCEFAFFKSLLNVLILISNYSLRYNN